MAGQRVVNEAEPALGLGHVKGMLDHRNVEIHFAAVGATRIYNVRTAPLKRLILRKGQEAVSRSGVRLRVARIVRRAGLLTYHGANGRSIEEIDLADVLPSSEAVDRLLVGQLSPHTDYGLRLDGWKLRGASLAHGTRGLVGARVRLLGHQLYIAHAVSRRESPRVLLADEVGLGKTIEAGLIFSALRALGRADRVLVLTPESLVHQWLAELYRKFNVLFSVLDEQRCADTDESPGGPTPFQSNSLCIVNLDFLANDELRLAQAREVEWDLIIVDEAHHLCEDGKPAASYEAVRHLSQQSVGLLLLTATPMRHGPATEFHLLHLVDPDRFSDLDTFLAEQQQMRQVAQLAARLAQLAEEPASSERAAVARELAALFPEDKALRRMLSDFQSGLERRSRHILRALVDRHGTGRVLIRNRRDRLKGFPGRTLNAVPLAAPERWLEVLGAVDPQRLDGDAMTALLASPAFLRPPHFAGNAPPPRSLDRLWKSDPRVMWLVEFAREHRGEKLVVMCNRPTAVLALHAAFREHTRIEAALFHENLSVVERDRQAAYFATSGSAQLLICSEIGGEGRNLQFAHHLVLFDLPIDPDLLEQRIGRLDRIGQEEKVQIWVPYVEGTPAEALFRWHHEGLGSFERHVSGSEQVLEAMRADVVDTLRAWVPSSPTFKLRDELLRSLLGRTRVELTEAQRKVHESVDYLVDLNSYDAEVGRKLIGDIEAIDHDAAVDDYLERLYDRYGVVEEDLDREATLRKIRPGEMMYVDSFAGLPADGIGATWRRDVALTREDLEFLTRDHWLVEGALALLLDQNDGRATAAAWQRAAGSSPGGGRAIVFQFLFLLEASGPPRLELNRWLPPTPVEIVLDHHGSERDELLSEIAQAGEQMSKLAPDSLVPIHAMLAEKLPALAEQARVLASSRLEGRRGRAVQEAEALLRDEQERLAELRRLNPNISEREVAAHADKMRRTLEALGEAQVRLDAVRLILVS